ncbi:hypothetical protein [Shimazuella alba]|uniref:Uncharacterized protein n=1 Tax=Shimazuella alba TaxID=2690964 RepID=A0A6I4VZ40_9BACL|nr:hypothetical protein [Shimazuella alba]MXQ55016.1 hypothetical protein [Shimazuella alba]
MSTNPRVKKPKYTPPKDLANFQMIFEGYLEDGTYAIRFSYEKKVSGFSYFGASGRKGRNKGYYTQSVVVCLHLLHDGTQTRTTYIFKDTGWEVTTETFKTNKKPAKPSEKKWIRELPSELRR